MPKDDFERFLLIAGLGVGGYLLYKIWNTATNPNAGTPYEGTGIVGTAANIMNQASGGALAATGTSIGGTLFQWINPAPGGPMIYYTTLFPDGTSNAVPSTSVDSNGNFTYNGAAYLMQLDANGNHVAVAAGP